MSKVDVGYSNFTNNSIAEYISFNLLPNTNLTLIPNIENSTILMTMQDKDTQNTALTGELDIELINTIIRSFTILRNQLLNNGGSVR